MRCINMKLEKNHAQPVPVLSQRLIYDMENSIFSYGNDRAASPDTYVTICCHMHRDFEMLHIIRGSMMLEAGKEAFAVTAGDIVAFNRYEPHFGYICREHPMVEYSYVTADLAKIAPTFEPNSVKALACGQMVCTRRLRDETLAAEIDAIPAIRDGGKPLLLTAQLLRVIGRLEALEVLSQTDGKRLRSTDFVCAMVDFLERHYSHEITPEMISAHFPYNQSYFCRLFKQNFGKPFYSYLSEYRIHQAITRYMNDPECTLAVSEIAALVGYTDNSRFAEDFRHLTYMTPSTYRKLRKQSVKNEKKDMA